MGNDAHVPDVVLHHHQTMDLVCCGSSAPWAVAATGVRIHTDGEVTANRGRSEQINDKEEGYGTSTYTMAAEFGG